MRPSETDWRGTTLVILKGPVPAPPAAPTLFQSLPAFSHCAGEAERIYGTIHGKYEATTVVVSATVLSSIFFHSLVYFGMSMPT